MIVCNTLAYMWMNDTIRTLENLFDNWINSWRTMCCDFCMILRMWMCIWYLYTHVHANTYNYTYVNVNYMYINDELEELLAEVNGEVEVCIHLSKEEEYEWYACMCCIHSRRKESANGVHIWYACKCMCILFMYWVCYVCTMLCTL